MASPAVNSTVSSPTSPTSTRTAINHERLLDAAVEALAKDGWVGCLPSPVGTRAGLSRQPALQRFPDRTTLALATWNERLEAPLTAALSELVEAFFASEPQPVRQAAAFQSLLTPSSLLVASAEVLVASQFSAELRTAVGNTIGRTVDDLVASSTSPAGVAAARALLIAQGLGLLMIGARSATPSLDAAAMAARFDMALHILGPASDLPESDVTQIYEEPIAFATGEPIRDRLLNAVLEQVGKHGFDGVNVKAIAKAAGYTEGALWNRWPSKMALFHEATQRQTAVGLAANTEWIGSIAREHGNPVAEAVAIREQMAPGRERIRAVYLEQARLTWRDPALADSVEAAFAQFLAASNFSVGHGSAIERATLVHSAWAMSYGIVLLAVIAPQAWTLPFVCVTAALEALDN